MTAIRMTEQEFLRQLEEDLEISSTKLEPGTSISEIEEWDSLATMTTLALIDENFGLDIEINRMNNLEKIGDIIQIIGENNFED